ncbi:PREDICTED: amelotin [Gekko japonicus]|uniref:Amelotin n=1 Tax=Gekko japonicus TaxID=146911 RepID=A0ABM1KT71_GEKJA|nr:PREDICTED: amelotin [Gekko japonicus]
MKIVILLLSLLGLTIAFPINQLSRAIAASNSKEVFRLLQRYRATGNNPQQTQQRSNPGYGLPPAKLVPDQTALTNQLPNEVTPLEWPFINFPVTLPKTPSELGATNWQPVPGFQLLPYSQMAPIDINVLMALLGHRLFPSTQILPGGGDGLNIPQQLLPPPQILPIILSHMGPQGAVLSSEEAESPSQVFTGLILPGMPGILIPSGQAEAPPDGQEGLLPAGQAGSNPGNSAGQLPFPEGTADATALAGIQKISPAMNDDLSGAATGLHPTPSGFRQPGYEHGVTQDPFAEPTVFIKINMEPSELREPPTTVARPENDKIVGGHTLAQSLVRGDSHMPVTTMESKPLREP